MPKTVACIIARTVSTRLPLKVLRDLEPNINMLDFIIERLKKVNSIDVIYICTSFEPVDDILEDVANRHDVKIYRGGTDDVIERMVNVSDMENAEITIRITGDNPLTSFEYIDNQVDFLVNGKLDYVRLTDVPIGATAEVIKTKALIDCYNKMDKSVSEYLMLFLFEPMNYKCGIIKVTPEDYSQYTVTVDTPIDLERTKYLLNNIPHTSPSEIKLRNILQIYDSKNSEVPAMKIAFSGSVKLPYDKIDTFENFMKDMERRKNNSEKLEMYG